MVSETGSRHLCLAHLIKPIAVHCCSVINTEIEQKYVDMCTSTAGDLTEP